MRSFSSSLSTALAGPDVTGAFLVTITRTDDEVYRLTTHSEDLTYNNNAYTAGIVSIGKLAERDKLKADEVDVACLIGTTITENDAQRRIFSGATVMIRWCDYTDTSINDIRFIGKIGSTRIEEGIVSFKCHSRRRVFERIVTKTYSPSCRCTFGDNQCGIDLDSDNDKAGNAIRTTATVGTVTNQTELIINVDRDSEDGDGSTNSDLIPVTETDTYIEAVAESGDVPNHFKSGTNWGGADFKVGQTITVSGFSNSENNGQFRIIGREDIGADDYIYVIPLSQGGSVLTAEGSTTASGVSVTVKVDLSYTPSGYFSHGKIVWYRGENDGITSDIREYTDNGDATGTVKLLTPPPFEVHVGDIGYIYGGCDKRRITCFNKYNNILNFRGEPDLPGMDHIQRYPDREPLEVSYS